MLKYTASSVYRWIEKVSFFNPKDILHGWICLKGPGRARRFELYEVVSVVYMVSRHMHVVYTPDIAAQFEACIILGRTRFDGRLGANFGDKVFIIVDFIH